MSRLLFCRECCEAKHRNCDGTAWDNEADAPAPCTCPDLSHTTERAAAAIADLVIADAAARRPVGVVEHVGGCNAMCSGDRHFLIHETAAADPAPLGPEWEEIGYIDETGFDG